MDDLLVQFNSGIASATPVIVGVFGSVIGLVFLVALGFFIVGRIRGTL